MGSKTTSLFSISQLSFPGVQVYYCPNCAETWIFNSSLLNDQWNEVMEMVDMCLYDHLVANRECANAIFAVPVGKK